MTPEEQALLEQVTSAHRARDVDGRIKAHPAWHDLDASGRVEAFEETVKLREMERGLDANGQSATVKAVLARISARR